MNRFTLRVLLAGAAGLLFFAAGKAQSPPGNPEIIFQSSAGAPSLGDETAPVTIVEFSDFECPYCGQHTNQVLPQIISKYVNTGKVHYIVRDLPIESLHPQAFKAAVAAHCAGEQGKYWEMHDRLFKNQELLADTQLAGHARALRLDGNKFKQCLDDGRFDAEIRSNIREAVKSGARGTPTFFVRKAAPQAAGNDAITILSGAQPFAAFERLLDAMLPDEKETSQ
jgi:protein-disulfide isomerase